MIFTPGHQLKVLDGRLTQVWMAINSRTSQSYNGHSIGGDAPLICNYRRGMSVPAKNDEREQFGILKIRDVAQQVVGEITREQAYKAGYENSAGRGSTALFFEEWRDRYGVLDRNELAWVITFEIDHDVPLYTARVVGAPGGDYSTKPGASNDELEVVGADALRKFAENAAAVDQVVRGKRNLESFARILGRRTREEILKAGRDEIPVDDELAAIVGALQSIEARRENAAEGEQRAAA